MRWEVERLGDARLMSTKRVTVRGADGSELFTSISRWGIVRDNLPYYGAVEPLQVVPPETLRDLEDQFAGREDLSPLWRMRHPVLFRHVDPPPYTRPVLPEKNHHTVWVRARGEVPLDPTLACGGAGLRHRHEHPGVSLQGRRLYTARTVEPAAQPESLTNLPCILRRPVWVAQFDSTCRTVAHGRAVATGEIFDRSGRHLASANQLGLIKFT